MFDEATSWLTEGKMTRKLQNLIIGRLLATFLLLVASWVWNSGRLKLSFDEFPRGLFFVFLISVGLTIVYFFVLRMSQNYRWQVRVQFFLDSLLITWLVWRTGDLTSPYIMLYIVLISVAGFFLSSMETIFSAVWCVLLFTFLSILTTNEILSTFGATPETRRAIQIISFNDIAFLLVGLLASRLSDRQASGEKLLEAKQSLAKLQVQHERIIESIRSGLITTDLEGRIFTFNAAAAEITGFSSEKVIGSSIRELLGDIDAQISTSIDQVDPLEHPSRFETDLTTPDGLFVRIGYTITPLISETGEKPGLIITFQDLTEIRRMEESVRRKDRLAAVGRVAAGLAHEIRNPLGAMRGAIQVMQINTPPESSNASLMEIILRESDRLNKIITNFLTYARPRVNNFSEVDVRAAIEETFLLLKHSPDVKDGHRLVYVPPAEPIKISADPTQLKQIFWNLSRNALNAMPDGGDLTVTSERSSNDRVRIVFSDTGCGMTPEQVEKLFEPFAESTTGGTGLGLSIVYQIVRDHNGTINVRSRENEGTSITVEIPTEPERQATPGGENDREYKSSRLQGFLNIKE
ncbi:MAG: PAS domain S-box protein [Acidobacteria bacterium]|nr:PAS domain S-box protein [Acidobacteriota bacterium]